MASLATVVVALAAALSTTTSVAAARPVAPGPAYWLVGSDGGVFSYGRAHFAGSATGLGLQRSIAGMAITPSGKGYWLVAKDGGVFAFGDAPYLGGMALNPLQKSVIGMAATPTGLGYWLVAADGGVFAYGDAGFYGSIALTALTAPVSGITATPSGKGYWLVAKDGGVFAFGDAPYLGAVAGNPLNRPVVAMAATPTGRGYWLLGGDGGVFAFGDAGWYGSMAQQPLRRSAVGIATTKSGFGYWVTSADGGVFSFGDAEYFGGAADAPINGGVVAIAAGTGDDIPSEQPNRLTGTFGWDVSWPQCRTPLPETGSFGVIGVTFGHSYSANPCLGSEFRWALRHGSVGGLYMNVNFPSDPEFVALPDTMASSCARTDGNCQVREYGVRAATDAVAVARSQGASAPRWWLDVETGNHWSANADLNDLVIQGAIIGLQSRGISVGIYSSQYQWHAIAGNYAPGLPTWIAGPNNVTEAVAACVPSASFGGGPPFMVQFPNGLDGNILCPIGVSDAMNAFKVPPPPVIPEFPLPPPPIRWRTFSW